MVPGWENRCWEKPEEGVVKINYDGSSNHVVKIAGCGGILRNHEGKWLGGFVSNLGHCPPLQAEAWGLLRSIQVANHMGFKNIVLEGDSSQLVDILRNGTTERSPILNILRACRQELRNTES